jgi:inositol transport system permease protein
MAQSQRTEPAASVAAGLRRIAHSAIRSPVVGIALAYLALVVAFFIATPRFLTTSNMSVVVGQTSAVTIAAFAMTMVILSGGIDLSVGAVLALVSVIVGSMLRSGYPLVVVILAGLAAGAVTGLVNGFVTVRWQVQPFLVTLGMLSVARGAAQLIAGGTTIAILDDRFTNLFAGDIGGIPVSALWTVLFLAVSLVLVRYTMLGRRLYAIGGNEQAAVQAGIRVGRVKVVVYVLSGLFAAVASLVASARLSAGLPGSGVGFELDVIAAVVLGGTGFRGEGGSVVGTLFGALIIGTVGNGLTQLGVDPFVQQIVKGGIILSAIVLESVRSRRTGSE